MYVSLPEGRYNVFPSHSDFLLEGQMLCDQTAWTGGEVGALGTAPTAKALIDDDCDGCDYPLINIHKAIENGHRKSRNP
jgi:hypothetical protein